MIIIDIIKTVLGKDADPSEVNKPFYLKRRYWGLGLTILGTIGYSYWGLVLDNTTKDLIMDNIQVISNSMQALISALTAIWGIYVALRGRSGQTEKLKAVANVLAVSPQSCNMPFPKVKPSAKLALNVANKLELPCPDETLVTGRLDGLK